MRPQAHVNRTQGRRTHAKLEWSGKKSNRIKIECNKNAWIMEAARCDVAHEARDLYVALRFFSQVSGSASACP